MPQPSSRPERTDPNSYPQTPQQRTSIDYPNKHHRDIHNHNDDYVDHHDHNFKHKHRDHHDHYKPQLQ